MRKIRAIKIALALCAMCVASACVKPQAAEQSYPFQDPNKSVEERVNNIVSLMTLEEKINALGTDPSVPRLGIKGSRHVEGLHGLAQGGPAFASWHGKHPVPTTQFPQAVGLGETWDPGLISQAAAAEAEEARYLFQSKNYLQGGIVVRAPNADLSRDPRWGRSEESYGEDAFLTGTMTVAFVKGLQGDDPKYWRAASLLKHFMANSNEDGRDGSSSNFDERLLREYYSVPFRMGIEEGGAQAFMTAYNAVNRIPMTVHPVLKNMVIKQWGFDGIICTDAGALTFSVTKHHYYNSEEEAVAGAIHAGINQFLDKYKDGVQGALKKGLITEKDIEEDIKGEYRVMIRLGLLDPPSMVRYTSIGEGTEPWKSKEHEELARKVTQESIVLLKNEKGMLPLDKSKIKSIAVIGPYADQVISDWYSGLPPYAISPVNGIQDKAGPGVKVSFTKGGSEAIEAARRADVAIMVVGNHPWCDAGWEQCPLAGEGKEAVDRKSITLEQEELIKRVFAANPRTVVVLRASFPYAINWTQEHVPAIVHTTNSSQEEGNALADVLFGDYNPGGKLVDTWPKSLEQLPPMMDYDLRHGRTYMYFKGEPLYPFGFGLSYTTFKYANAKVSSNKLAANGRIIVSVDITNSGPREGDEVVQLYVKHSDAKVAWPNEELKGFQRVNLQPGETKTVKLPLAAKSLAYFDEAQGKFVLLPEPVTLRIGSSSADIRMEQKIAVVPAE